MDENEIALIIIDLVLKGGPPWGFRIMQRSNKVIISKVNCGGRAYKNGLRVNDEILAVNNLEINKHPLTLIRQIDQAGPEDLELNSIKLSKLDFTYQLIKHTYNRRLHLKVCRSNDSDTVQSCCYWEEDKNEAVQVQVHNKELLSPVQETEVKLNPCTLEPAPLDLHICSNSVKAGPSSIHQANLDSVPLSSCKYLSDSLESEESDMTGAKGPSFKAKAPKNIWSPGSTTTSSSSSDINSTTCPATIASATQTSPAKSVQVQKAPFVTGNRPVKMSSVDVSMPSNSEPSVDHVLPSSISEPFDDRKLTINMPSNASFPATAQSSTDQQAGLNQLKVDTIGSIVTDKEPPKDAKLVYENSTTKYYTLPATSVTEKTMINIPAPKKYDGIGPLNESGVPVSLRTGVKDEYASDWYKTMFKRLHKFEKPRSFLDEPIKVKIKSKKGNRLDYFSEDETCSRIQPGSICDYEPGRSSISLKEKQENSSPNQETKLSSANLLETASSTDNQNIPKDNRNGHFKMTRSPSGARNDFYHKDCVFNTLTDTSGYKSDSSYIIKKKEPQNAPTPASHSTYCAIQRGDMDIPLSGLQKPAPAPHSHKVGPAPQMRSPTKIWSTEVTKRSPTSYPLVADESHTTWSKEMKENFDTVCQEIDESQQAASRREDEKMISFYNPNHLKEEGLLYSSGKSFKGKPFEDNLKSADYLCSSLEPEHKLDDNRSYEIDSLIKEIQSGVDFHSEIRRESPHRFDERAVNIHYKSPVQSLVKDSNYNQEDLLKYQRDMMQRYYENEYEKRIHKQQLIDANRSHHFQPYRGHVVAPDRYQKAYAQKDNGGRSVLLARVLFDFNALSGREISVQKGDIVIVHRPIDHNWIEIEDSQSGLKGLVPRNYLDYEQEGYAKAKYDFYAKTCAELTFKKGETLKLLRKVDNNWYEGTNSSGHGGLIPCSYVETLKPPLVLKLDNNAYFGAYNPNQNSNSPIMYSASPPRPSSPRYYMNGTTNTAVTTTTRRGLCIENEPKYYIVKYRYKPQQEDELELLVGDILTVTMQCDDGWFYGKSGTTKKQGIFPGNYVEPL